MTGERVITPRWEWRTFGDRFPEAEAALTSVPVSTKTSTETYLLCRVPGVNAKIRGETLDVKRLLQVERGLELWTPVLQVVFPIDAAAIGALFAEWKAVCPALARPQYSRDQFLTEIIATTSAVRAVVISKVRRQATLEECAVEVSTVTVGAQEVQTVAVESERPDLIAPVVRRLGLAGVGNENYVVALTRLSTGAQEGATS